MNARFPHRLAGTQVSPAADLGLPCPGSAVTPIGAGLLGPTGPTEAAGAPNRLTSHKMECLECEGEGTVEVLDLDATRPYCAICDTCDGTGLVEPYCEVCQGKLAVDYFCYDCDSYADFALTWVERISPTRIAL